MNEFNTSLLREKFVIHDREAARSGGRAETIALSNRIVLDLESEIPGERETLVVRAQNMHSCVRMSGKILGAFNSNGPLVGRVIPYDWKAAYDSLVGDYEHTYNPQRWVSIYHNGRKVFVSGNPSPILDVIEQCNAHNKGTYDDAVLMAEGAFRQVGKDVKIEHDANVALVTDFEGNYGRCAIILRGPDRTTTFNFTARGNADRFLNIPQCLGVAAAFLEGIQLAFMVGMNEEKIRLGRIARHSKDEKQTVDARRRLGQLSSEISNLEMAYDVNYRPERPEFPHIIMDAEKVAQKIFGES